MKFKSISTLFILGIAAVSLSQTPGRLLLLQVGTETFSANGNTMQLQQIVKTGGSQNPTSLFSLPTTNASGICTIASSVNEGSLTRTPSGRFVGFTGYDGALATSDRVAGASSSVSRIAGRLDFTGSYNLTTRHNNSFSSGSTRSIVWSETPVSDGTNQRYRVFASGSNEGIRTSNFGATSSTLISSTSTDNQNITLVNGSLYFSTASGTPGIKRVAGLPTSSTTATNLINTSGSSPFGFVFIGDVSGLISCYVADSVDGLVKYTSTTGITGTFTQAYVVSSTRMRQICTDGKVIFGVTAGGPLYTLNNVVAIWDGGSAGASVTETLTNTAPSNTAYRGVQLSPEPAVVDNDYTSSGTAGNIMTLRSGDGAQRTLRVGLVPDSDNRAWTNLATINYSGQAVKTAIDSSGNTYILIQGSANSGASIVPTVSIRKVPVGGGSAVSSSEVNIPAGYDSYGITVDSSNRPVVAYRPSSGAQQTRFVRWSSDLTTGTVFDNSGSGFSSGSKTPVDITTDPNNYFSVLFASSSTLSTTAFSSTFSAGTATSDLAMAADGSNAVTPIAGQFGSDGLLRVLSVGATTATRALMRVDTLASGNTSVTTAGTNYRRDATGTASGAAVSPAFLWANGLTMKDNSACVTMLGTAEPTTGPSGPGVGAANRNDNIIGSGKIWILNSSNAVTYSLYRFAAGFSPVN